jgi:hypothetical protein
MTMSTAGLRRARWAGGHKNLGDFEETAWEMALEFFESFLENAGCPGCSDSSTGFALWMAQTAMPLIERPDGTIFPNLNACEIWRDGFLFPEIPR